MWRFGIVILYVMRSVIPKEKYLWNQWYLLSIISWYTVSNTSTTMFPVLSVIFSVTTACVVEWAILNPIWQPHRSCSSVKSDKYIDKIVPYICENIERIEIGRFFLYCILFLTCAEVKIFAIFKYTSYKRYMYHICNMKDI